MLIDRLQLLNFKSYLGRHVIGPFDNHFTCVVGPNGNGKSNIIDAILFVFGFKSAKLRQDSLASLIHRSAFGTPNECEVTVVFKQSQIYTKISRTVKKNGQAFYKLNQQKINWSELRQKFIQKDIDLDKNLFIILQGEVQKLCELSHQKFVEYLESITGSDQFIDKIKELESKITDNFIVKQQMQLSFLRKKKEYQRLKDKLSICTSWILIKFRLMLQQHILIKKYLMDLTAQKEQLLNDEEIELQLLKQIQINNRAKKQKQKELQRKKIEKQKNLEIFQKQTHLYSDQMNMNEMKVKQIYQVIKDTKRDIQQAQNQIQKLEKQRQQINTITNNLKQVQKNYKKIKSNLEHRGQITKFRFCLDSETKLAEICQQNEKLSSQKSNIVKQIQAIKKNKQTIKLNQFSKEDIIKVKVQIKNLNSKQYELKSKLQQNQELITQLKSRATEQQNPKSNSPTEKVIQQIITANKLNLICAGYKLAPLRQNVIIIDRSYEYIMETMLPQLDFIIVDNYEQAKSVTDFLLENKIGRMTFIIKQIINKIRLPNQYHNYQAPKRTKRLFDLCKGISDDITKILFWAIGNTLVTDNIETAMEVGFNINKRHRIVTTNGKLIDDSGAMTSLVLKKGNQNTKYQKQLAIKKIQTIQTKISFLKKDLQLILKGKENAIKTLAGFEEIKAIAYSFDPEILIDLENEEKQVSKCIIKNQAQIESLKSNYTQMKKAILNIGLNQQDYSLVLGEVKQLEQAEQQINKIQASNSLKLNIQQNLTRTKQKIKSLELKIENLKAQELNSLTKSKTLATLKIQSLVQKFSQTKNDIKRIQQDLNALESQFDLTLKIGKKNQNKIDPQSSIRKIRQKIKQIEINRIAIIKNYSQSLNQIRQFAELIELKIVASCSDLITERQDYFEKDSTKVNIFNKSLLLLGKKQLSFFELLNSKQKIFFKEHLNFDTTTFNQDDEQLTLCSIQTKKLELIYSLEQRRLDNLRHPESNDEKITLEQIDFGLYEQYLEKKSKYEKQQQKMQQLNLLERKLAKSLLAVKNSRLDCFMKGFNQINGQLKRIYSKLTGGSAELSFSDNLNPFQGICFCVRPVNKSWKNVNLLSGGQKTFTSLALIYACEQIKKFPFYFMDEIDAALDYRNTGLLAAYLKEKKATQYIVVSLRRNMYQECNKIIGVYKIKDQSRAIAIEMSVLNSL